ncbi:hypothetical protein [Thioalkalivibrio sp. HK1]|uniref:hypothetical protein n=1 Tax=Thioalkalivibrio sp. HK1 TaxID=1469245 RepID=UPI0004729738|nr:hypothetical protein [Thioalkalivibrio sp. HK1]
MSDATKGATMAGGGALAGAAIPAVVGKMGLAVGGTAVAVGAAPLAVAGAVAGLALFGISKLF